ncbi:MAG: hypothetical protein YFSK_0400 [Candidatus Yanofskyibacterium parasiticum]|nr:MAG: hypothetical protein YFSK_0400 [Candidatus Yanofskybacteria bacterium]
MLYLFTYFVKLTITKLERKKCYFKSGNPAIFAYQ